MNILSKIKDLFTSKKESKIIQKDIEKEYEFIKKIREEIRQNELTTLVKWEELEPFCSFKDKNTKHVLILDDDKSSANLIEKDLITILNKDYTNRNYSKKTKEAIKNNKIKKDSEVYEIKTIDDVYAPYKVIKTCEEFMEELCYVDLAIVDIIFGEYVIKDGKKIYLDGIDVAEYLINRNPNAKIILFTGCYLDNDFSIEKEKIVEKLGVEFLRNNVVEKTPDYNERIFNLINAIES